MRSKLLPLAVAATLALPAAYAGASPVVQAAEKKVVTSADQLPRRQYQITKLPSELLDAPKSELKAAVDAIDKDLETDLATLDIRDRATRTGMLAQRAQVAVFRGDYAKAQEYLREIRAQQEKEADKLTSGVLNESILATRLAGGTVEQQKARLKATIEQRYAAMPWTVVGDNLKNTKSSLELMARNTVIGGFQSSLDPAAKNLNLNVPAGIAMAIVSAKNTFEHVEPFKGEAIAVIQALVDKNQVAKVDNWWDPLESTCRHASLSIL